MVQMGSDKCCGCSACLNVCPKHCIQMIQDNEGFYIPSVDINNCIGCSLCEKVCPALANDFCSDIASDIGSEVYYAYNLNDVQRENSSSGGVFVLLAIRTLEDGGVVFGASFTEDCYTVEHKGIISKNDLDSILRSKYVQSLLTNQFSDIKNYLENGREVLFCGTPCQVAGLKRFLQRDYDNLTCVDFICHGVPSPKAWEYHAKDMEKRFNSKLKSFSFRHKKVGWHTFSCCYNFNSTTMVIAFDEDVYGKMFIRNNGLRECCYHCDIKGKNYADITIADAWGVENSHPDLDDDKGTSLVYIHTDKGRALFDSISEEIKSYHCESNEGIRLLSRLTSISGRHPQRSDFYKHIDEVSFDKLVRKYCRPSLRNFLGQTIRKAKRLL